MLKTSTFDTISSLCWYFAVGLTRLLPTEIKFDIKLHSKPFLLQKSIFLHFNQKKRGLRDNFSERLLNFCPLNRTRQGRMLNPANAPTPPLFSRLLIIHYCNGLTFQNSSSNRLECMTVRFIQY